MEKMNNVTPLQFLREGIYRPEKSCAFLQLLIEKYHVKVFFDLGPSITKTSISVGTFSSDYA